MHVGIPHRAAINDQRMVQEAAVSVRCVFEPFEERRHRTDVVLIQLGEFRDILWVFPVVGAIVELVLDAAFRVHA